MKLFARLSLAVIFLFNAAPISLAKSYPDVWDGHKYFEAITSLTGRGIVSGYPNGQFKPEDTINRAEATKILVGANFSKEDINHSLDIHREKRHTFVRFPDVPINEWFGTFVSLAYQRNILDGYPDGTFKPADQINFAEALKIILNTYKVNPSTVPYTPSDMVYMQQGEWFEPFFTYARSKNLVDPDKFYHPGQFITRGEFAEIIYRLSEVQTKGLDQYPIKKDVSSSDYFITIPKLDIINQKIAFSNPYDPQGALAILRLFPFGHYLAAPGSGKKFVIYGHSSGYAWDSSPYKVVLRQINKLQAGDKIYINYKEKGYVYAVQRSEIIPASQDQLLLADKNTNEMAMYTCWPPDSTQQRYVVYSRPL